MTTVSPGIRRKCMTCNLNFKNINYDCRETVLYLGLPVVTGNIEIAEGIYH